MGEFEGVNPANGVVIYYQLPKLADSIEVKMEIKDAAGKVVRTYSSKADEKYEGYPGGPPANPTLMKGKGLNRHVWDMRYPIMMGAPKVYIESSFRAHKASPGAYSVTVKYGSTESNADFKILPNPHYPTTPAQYEEYHTFMSEMESNLNTMHRQVATMLKARNQLEAVIKDMGTQEKYAALKKEAEALVKKMTAWDDDMLQRKAKAYDDVDNYENKFTANYMFLINQTESDIPRVNKPNRDRRAELEKDWAALEARSKAIMETEVPAYTKKLWEAGIGAIY
ncbi:MAG: hypothetical protein JNL40_15175 [Cyclobacteriaceae bacterium]|nr:hypothetical protein [Cyclobacteriaceae bacterium]